MVLYRLALWYSLVMLPSATRFLVRAWYRVRFLLFQRHRFDRLALEWVAQRPFLILPQVFNPALFWTSEWLAQALNAHLIPAGSQVLDMGTGSGVGAIFAAQWTDRVTAVDINPAAVRCAQINVLLNELEDLTKQVVDVIQEAQRPIIDSIAKEVAKRVEDISEADALAVATAIVSKAAEKCFKNWFLQSHMDTELYREFTILLATQFKNRQLHGAGKDFVDRCIRLLKKVRFMDQEEQC